MAECSVQEPEVSSWEGWGEVEDVAGYGVPGS